MTSRTALAGISGARLSLSLSMCISVCLLLAFLAAGCGQSRLDTSKLESQIKTTLSDRSGFTIRSVNCPRDVKPTKGATFHCTVTTGRNEQVAVNVIQENGSGAVTWRLAGPLKR